MTYNKDVLRLTELQKAKLESREDGYKEALKDVEKIIDKRIRKAETYWSSKNILNDRAVAQAELLELKQAISQLDSPETKPVNPKGEHQTDSTGKQGKHSLVRDKPLDNAQKETLEEHDKHCGCGDVSQKGCGKRIERNGYSWNCGFEYWALCPSCQKQEIK